jgi:molecular chaperone DnaK (HSP70)
MQIRERGKKVVCIKTEYVPEKKRTYGRVVASQDKFLSTVSDDVCQQLSKEEVDELQKWLDDRQEKETVDMLERRLSIVRAVTEGAAEALERDLGELADSQADEIWQAMARLQKALKKAGHPRPRKQTKKPAADDRQDKLL